MGFLEPFIQKAVRLISRNDQFFRSQSYEFKKINFYRQKVNVISLISYIFADTGKV